MHNLPKGHTIDCNSVLRTSQRQKLKKYSALLFMALILHPALYHEFWAGLREVPHIPMSRSS